MTTDPTTGRRSVTIPLPRLPSLAGAPESGIATRGLWMALGVAATLWWTGHLGLPRPAPAPGPAPAPAPTPTPAPVVPASEFFRLGRGYRGTILSTYADALESGAAQIAGGVDVGQALASVGSSWSAARAKAFDSTISPALERIAPDGDKSRSAELAAAFRELARGVR